MTRRLSKRQTCLYFGLAACLGLVLLTTGMEMPNEKAGPTTGMEMPNVEPEEPLIDPNIDLKLPAMVVLGATGSGKSTFINMIDRVVRDDVWPKKPLADTSGEKKRETIRPKAYQINASEGNKDMMLIDTPGLADTEGQDEEIRHNIIEFLATLKARDENFGVNTFAIVVNQTDPRFTQSMQDMITFFVRMFGPNFLDHVAIVLRSWPYTKHAINTLQTGADNGRGADIREIKVTKTEEMRENLYKLLLDARTNDEPITISNATLDRIRNNVPVYFVNSIYDRMQAKGRLEEEQYSMADAQVQALLTNMRTAERYPCVRMNDNIKSETKKMEEEYEELKAEEEKMQKELKEFQKETDAHIKWLLEESRRKSAENAKKLQEAELSVEEKLRIQKEDMEQLRRCQEQIKQQQEELRKKQEEADQKAKDLKKEEEAMKKREEQRKKDAAWWRTFWKAVGAGIAAVGAGVLNAIPGGQAAAIELGKVAVMLAVAAAKGD